MKHKNLDATLKSAHILGFSLGRWLITASESPDKVRVQTVEDQEYCRIIELQNKEGIAVGGIAFANSKGVIHIDAAIDSQNEPYTKKRTVEEMEAAQLIAITEDQYQNRCVRFCEFCINFGLPLCLIGILFYLLYSVL